MEFAVLEIKGQSFMLHQIRKMVAFVVAVARNIVSQEMINEAFKMDKFEIPLAPSLGLCLHHVRHFLWQLLVQLFKKWRNLLYY